MKLGAAGGSRTRTFGLEDRGSASELRPRIDFEGQHARCAAGHACLGLRRWPDAAFASGADREPFTQGRSRGAGTVYLPRLPSKLLRTSHLGEYPGAPAPVHPWSLEAPISGRISRMGRAQRSRILPSRQTKFLHLFYCIVLTWSFEFVHFMSSRPCFEKSRRVAA